MIKFILDLITIGPEPVMKKIAASCRYYLTFCLAVIVMLFSGMAPAQEVNFGGPGMPEYRAATEGGIPGGWGSDACDEDYINLLKTQAWLAGQYEILVNQTTILKPDSVFEYTCFHQFLGYTADPIAYIFSESDAFDEIVIDIGALRGPRIIFTGFSRERGSMADALTLAVIEPLTQYLENSFGHTFLGGTSGLDGEAPAIGGAEYTCELMAAIWYEAKCTNFDPGWMADAGRGGLYEIEDFVGLDPRLYPEECANSQVFQEYIDLSNNVDLAFHDVDPYFPEDYFDSYELLRDASCTSPPIPVGLPWVYEIPVLSGNLVIGQEREPKEEFACPNQGCHYDGAGACVH
jgi:hypothetical protein